MDAGHTWQLFLFLSDLHCLLLDRQLGDIWNMYEIFEMILPQENLAAAVLASMKEDSQKHFDGINDSLFEVKNMFIPFL